MTSKTESSSSGGIGFLGLLTILFIALKLTGHITWSWWWVLSPVWGLVAAIAGISLVCAVGAMIVAGTQMRKRRKRNKKRSAQ